MRATQAPEQRLPPTKRMNRRPEFFWHLLAVCLTAGNVDRNRRRALAALVDSCALHQAPRQFEDQQHEGCSIKGANGNSTRRHRPFSRGFASRVKAPHGRRMTSGHRVAEGPTTAQAATVTVSVWGAPNSSGTGSPSASSPAMWTAIASAARSRHSSTVLPWVKQPASAGTKTM
jgi:hypothetical protein